MLPPATPRRRAPAFAAAVVGLAALLVSSTTSVGAADAEPPDRAPGASPQTLPAPRSHQAQSHRQRSQLPQQAAARRASASSAGVLALNWGDLDATPEAWKGNYIVMQPWEYDRIPAFRAHNPGVKILMYKDVSATVKRACSDAACTRDNKILPTGIGYHWAKAHHPGWFLRDRAGHPIEWSDWPGLFHMDVGNGHFQDRWARNVLTELKAHDWDGVMLDDVLTSLSHTTVGDRVPAKVPTDAAQYADTTAFLAKVGPRLRDAGFLAMPNVAFQWNDWKTILQDWSPYVSGWENEYFVKWGLDDSPERFDDADWTWKMRLSAWCARNDQPLLAVTYSAKDDRATQVYHRATWLLTWNGHSGASFFVPAENFTDHWMNIPTTFLGQPRSRRTHDRTTGVWSRRYSGGLVLVNPTREAVTVSLAHTYRTVAGRAVDRVRLKPTTGALLRD
jgi:hypothetical protein